MTQQESARRILLKLLGATSVSVLLPGCGAVETPSPPPSATSTPSRLIIIGTGMAGLAAAKALKIAGIDAMVLEARNRIGGLLWTRDLGGITIDFGAS